MGDVQTSRQSEADELIAQLRRAGQHPPPALLDAIRALGVAAVPSLLAMVTNPTEYDYDEADNLSGWAPYHALDLLGELRSPETLEPLLGLTTWDDYDYLSEQLPDVLAGFGEPALDGLTAILNDSSHTVWTRWTAVQAMEELAGKFPALREEIVTRLTAQLDIDEPDSDDPGTLEGAIAGTLAKLHATESLPSLLRAYESDRVDEFVTPWSEVRAQLNVSRELAPHLDQRERERRFYLAPPVAPPAAGYAPPSPSMRAGGSGASAPYRRETPKVGRNDPCPCGSGKKYKKCHGK